MSSELVVVDVHNGVATLRMNHLRRLNGWTVPMQAALRQAFERAATDARVKAVVLTGTGKYYSAGVDLSGALRLDHPRRLHALIVDANYRLFDLFIGFPKPILAAINGIAIGAPVTSATLCDAMVAAEGATFETPFAKVGLPAEGCSSVHFPRLLGAEAAARMLGPEGWRPSATEALDVGLVDAVVPADQLLTTARAWAEDWIQAGRSRQFRAGAERRELEQINREESRRVADAFFSPSFLMGRYRWLSARRKTGPALAFLALRATRPAWSWMLPRVRGDSGR
jgi:enoyl-CoA hydratase/carnithine racemase